MAFIVKFNKIKKEFLKNFSVSFIEKNSIKWYNKNVMYFNGRVKNMKIRIGIAGYGNLGRGVECAV